MVVFVQPLLEGLLGGCGSQRFVPLGLLVDPVVLRPVDVLIALVVAVCHCVAILSDLLSRRRLRLRSATYCPASCHPASIEVAPAQTVQVVSITEDKVRIG